MLDHFGDWWSKFRFNPLVLKFFLNVMLHELFIFSSEILEYFKRKKVLKSPHCMSEFGRSSIVAKYYTVFMCTSTSIRMRLFIHLYLYYPCILFERLLLKHHPGAHVNHI